MIAISSLSPSHINQEQQKKAIQSWIDLGLTVVSLNCQAECDKLKPEYPEVHFYPTTRTLEAHYGKPYVQISAIFDFCKVQDEDYFCIINSDIELRCDKGMIERVKVEMLNTLPMCNRIDHSGASTGNKYLAGIDVFFIHKRFLNSFPQSQHALGMTFVDFFIPYFATKAGIQTVFIENDIAFHLMHGAQYSEDNWKKSGRYFQWETGQYQFNPTKEIGRFSTFIHAYIYNSALKIKI